MVDSSDNTTLSLSLSPIGHLFLYVDTDEVLPQSIAEKINSFFSISESVGLLRLGLINFESLLPLSFTFWQQFSKIFVTEICKTAEHTLQSAVPFPEDEINHLIAQAPGENNIHIILKQSLNATLRSYQARGVEWLWWLYNMRLGGCLADDMGLGKTIQMIALLLLIKKQKKNHQSHLLILPASLLGNWQTEINRFAPELSLWIAHGIANRDNKKPDLSKIDVIITTYGTLQRLLWLSETAWDLVILDEAQAIKNPLAKQTRTIKLLTSRVRFILTGTPIENRLLDLWSLFDFVAPGLLGSNRVFADLSKSKSKEDNKVR